MISSRNDLKEYIDADMHWPLPEHGKGKALADYTQTPFVLIKKYLYYLRKQEYYINTAKGSKIKGIFGLYYERRKNKLGLRLGIEIGPNCFEKGLTIWHTGNIIVNPAARIGKNCRLHGGNCIGNKGNSKEVPLLGNNVDVGFGAVIIGDVEIADNVVIGANAVVNKSILESGCVAAGIPAKVIKHGE